MIDFDEMITNYLKRESYPKQKGRYYPSQIGSCMRKAWYSYISPVETDAELVKIFEVGNMMHEFIVRVIESDKNPHIHMLKNEFPFRHEIEDFVISGRIDDLILLKSENKKVLVEVKTTANINFITEPLTSNVMQLQLYLHFFSVDDGLLVYIDKRDMKCKSFEVKYNVDEALKILERFKMLHKKIVTNTVPEPEARSDEKTIWICKKCEYREKCYEETPANQKWL